MNNAFCMKCKEMVQIKNPIQNGKVVKGKCSTCQTTVCKFVSKKTTIKKDTCGCK
jgi:hypothetical protein